MASYLRGPHASTIHCRNTRLQLPLFCLTFRPASCTFAIALQGLSAPYKLDLILISPSNSNWPSTVIGPYIVRHGCNTEAQTRRCIVQGAKQ